MTIEEMFDQNGWDTAEIKGEVYYTTRDENDRAVVGPRRRNGRGLLALGRRKHAITRTRVGEQPVSERPSFKERLVGHLMDREWHRAVQHTAVDVALWAACGSLAAVCLKVAYWVVTL